MAPPRSTASQAALKFSSVNPPPRLAGSEMKPCSVFVATRRTQKSGKSTAITATPMTIRAPHRAIVPSLMRSPLVLAPQPAQQQLTSEEDRDHEDADDGDGRGQAEAAGLDPGAVDLVVDRRARDAGSTLRQPEDPRQE